MCTNLWLSAIKKTLTKQYLYNMSIYDTSGRRRSNMEAGVEKESGTILRMGPWMSKINADNGKLL